MFKDTSQIQNAYTTRSTVENSSVWVSSARFNPNRHHVLCRLIWLIIHWDLLFSISIDTDTEPRLRRHVQCSFNIYLLHKTTMRVSVWLDWRYISLLLYTCHPQITTSGGSVWARLNDSIMSRSFDVMSSYIIYVLPLIWRIRGGKNGVLSSRSRDTITRRWLDGHRHIMQRLSYQDLQRIKTHQKSTLCKKTNCPKYPNCMTPTHASAKFKYWSFPMQ